MARPVLILAALAGLAPAWFAAPAAAENTSVYTKLLLDQCRQEPADPDDPLQSGKWWCDGYQGIPVRVSEGDLRFLISYGPDAANEMAAGQTLPQFNTINETLEWRLAPWLDGKPRPIATILRYYTDLAEVGGGQGQVLVITALGGPGQVCHMGYVDALLNPDANALAREVADNGAPGHDCQRDSALWYGSTGDDARE